MHHPAVCSTPTRINNLDATTTLSNTFDAYHNNGLSNDLDSGRHGVDADYEDIAQILQRLHVSTNILLPRISLACTCMLSSRHKAPFAHASKSTQNEAGDDGDKCHVVSCSDDESSEEESDEDDDSKFSVAPIL